MGGKIFVCSKLGGFCKSGRYVDQDLVPFRGGGIREYLTVGTTHANRNTQGIRKDAAGIRKDAVMMPHGCQHTDATRMPYGCRIQGGGGQLQREPKVTIKKNDDVDNSDNGEGLANGASRSTTTQRLA